jgi:peptidase E
MHSMNPTIVAIGGGSLTNEPESQAIERYVLGLTGKESPRVCFLPTGSNDAPANLARFYTSFANYDCRPAHLSLSDGLIKDLRGFILAQDAVFVGGGNAETIGAKWRESGLDEVLREAWEGGIVLSGVSGGAICWHQSGIIDANGTPLTGGLGFIKGSFCPHFNADLGWRPAFEKAVSSGKVRPGLACENNVAVRYEGNEAVEFVSADGSARAWRVERTWDGDVGVSEIKPRLLAD